MQHVFGYHLIQVQTEGPHYVIFTEPAIDNSPYNPLTHGVPVDCTDACSGCPAQKGGQQVQVQGKEIKCFFTKREPRGIYFSRTPG